MMTETQKRIKAYKAALPGLRQRVFAVGVLLLMSAAMMVSVSVAWVTLSTNPEVSSATTQVASNGSLEIALAGVYDDNGDLTEPEQSKVGDSSAAEGQSIVASNLTWGNLVNLSDDAYGLDQIVLRPAALSTANLATNPLRSAVYGADGRVDNSNNDDFAYCVWQEATEGSVAHFAVANGLYGVRAVSTVTTKYEADISGGETDLANVIYFNGLMDTADYHQGKVREIYPSQLLNETNSKGKKYMDDLCTIIGLFLNKKFATSSDEDLWNVSCNDYLESLVGMCDLFADAMYQELEAMAALANAQRFVAVGNDSFTPYTAETLLTTTESTLTKDGVKLEDFTQFIKDYKTILKDLEMLEGYYAQATDPVAPQTILFEKISNLVNDIVDVNTCWIYKGSTSMQVKDIAGVSGALELLTSSGSMEVKITDGILARFEERVGEYVYGTYSVSITVRRTLAGITAKIPYTAEATVYTAYRNQSYLYASDRSATQTAFDNSDLNKGNKIETAGDTYGLAIDLWVRTNAVGKDGKDTYLTLEGDVIYSVASGTDADGNEVAGSQLFYYEETDETSGAATKYYVYRTSDGYYYENGTNTPANNLSGKTLTLVYEDAPTGYEGENRVWEEWQQSQLSPSLSDYNTTQGGGSCYIFYSDTPTEQQATLNLLSDMYVVFIDGSGQYLATASFDTEENHYYSVGGKVTVPLVVSQGGKNFTDESGEAVRGITTLVQNEATRITALVYLDGTELTNKEALAASEIQGTLNLQFGSSAELQTIGDKTLQEAERTVSATVKTANSDNVLSFFDNDNLSAEVTVTVTGDQPTNVKAFFQREINSSQGSREESMTFALQGDGTWKANYTFTAPGDYVLRSVQLDGVDYELAEPQRVTVKGFTITSVVVMRNGALITDNSTTIITPDNTVSLGLSLTTAADSTDERATPKSVQVIFLRDDATTVTADLSLSSNTWTGSANLTSSGVYKMQYAMIDGEYYDLGTNSKTITAYMGMKAYLYTQEGQATSIRLEETDTGATLSVRAKIRDNSNNYLEAQEGVWIYYKPSGSNTPIEAELEWNSETGYYEGNFIDVTELGTYTFSYMKVGNNIINSAGASPTFRLFSAAVVEYVDCINDGTTTFALAGGSSSAYMNLQIKNSGGAIIRATFTDANGKEYVVEDTYVKDNGVVEETTTRNWAIRLPEATEGDQGGTWTLTELEMSNVTDRTGTVYSEGRYVTIDLPSNPTVTVISEFQTELSYVSDNFGDTDKDGTVDATFMTAFTKGDFQMQVYYTAVDENGDEVRKPLPPDECVVSEVKLIYKHQGDSGTWGHYTMNATVGDVTVKLEKKGDDNMTFTPKSATTFQTAGTYKLTSASITINNKTYPVKITGEPTITVETIAPTVKITAISPTGTHSVDNTTNESISDESTTSGSGCNATTTYTLNSAHSNATSLLSNDGLTATVYFQCFHSGETGQSSQEYHHYYGDNENGIPQVTIELSNLDNFDSATLNFNGSTHIYNKVEYTEQGLYGTWETTGEGASYSWTQNNTSVTRCIGYSWNQKGRISGDISEAGKKRAAGTITANTLTVTAGTQTYTFTIPTITIKNPY